MQLRTQRWIALFAIALLAINLRTAVSSLSPIVSFIQEDIDLPIVTIGLLGIAAPLSFALATSLSYRPARRLGVEKTMLLTALMIVTGHLVRAFAWDSSSLFFGSILSLLGMGIGNVLMPVMVRKYFPTRVGVISSFYITLTAISATAGSFFAVPVAQAYGWRFSLGQWALLAFLTAIPLLFLLAQSKPENRIRTGGGQKAIWKSKTAWAIAGTQAITSLFGYISFAYLPLILVEHNKIAVLTAGQLLSLFAVMGLPAALAIPLIATKYPRSHSIIIYFSGIMGVLGPLGILFGGNQLLWLWVVFTGLGPTMFPLALTLFNLRSRERSTVLALSAFGQGFSYVMATITIFTIGVIREISGVWDAALWILLGASTLSLLLGIQIAKGKMVDDELAH